MNDDYGQTIYIPNPTPPCDHPKPYRYEPKNDKVALATKKRKEKEARVKYERRFIDGLKATLSAVWDAEFKK
jgi:hypothetical protein